VVNVVAAQAPVAHAAARLEALLVAARLAEAVARRAVVEPLVVVEPRVVVAVELVAAVRPPRR
jgi:hypothetical protein